MAIDKELVKLFVESTNDSEPTDTTPTILIGTMKSDGTVLLDGAESPTPCVTNTTNYSTGDRVTCVIENHELKITGNVSQPSVTKAEDLGENSITKDQMVEGSIPLILDGDGAPDPEGHHDGDVYFDSENGNAIYIFKETEEGGEWVLKQFSGGAVAVDGTMVYYTEDEPESGKVGDTWFKKQTKGSGYDYILYEYVEGSGWTKAELDGSTIKAGTITASQIKAGAITANEIDSQYVYSGTISGGQIYGGTISGVKFEGKSINGDNWTWMQLSDYVDTAHQTRKMPQNEITLSPEAVNVSDYNNSDDRLSGSGSLSADGLGWYHPTYGWSYFGAFGCTYCGSTILNENNYGSYVTPAKIGALSTGANGYDGSINAHGARYVYMTGSSQSYDLTSSGTGDHYTIHAVKSGSCRRFKHDIETLHSEEVDADKLYNVRVVEFKYNDDFCGDTEEERQANYKYGKILPGFIVEELQEVYPNCLKSNPEDGYFDWDVKLIVPGMLKLIQDQKKKIDELEARLVKLESRENDSNVY